MSKIPCSCKNCNDYYIEQTCRPIIKRIKEHEACYRLNNYIDSTYRQYQVCSCETQLRHGPHHRLEVKQHNNTNSCTEQDTAQPISARCYYCQ